MHYHTRVVDPQLQASYRTVDQITLKMTTNPIIKANMAFLGILGLFHELSEIHACFEARLTRDQISEGIQGNPSAPSRLCPQE